MVASMTSIIGLSFLVSLVGYLCRPTDDTSITKPSLKRINKVSFTHTHTHTHTHARTHTQTRTHTHTHTHTRTNVKVFLVSVRNYIIITFWGTNSF